MNVFEKLIKSWWVILSFICFLNGFGFVYIGSRHSNQNWIIEGVIYEIPWFFYIIYLIIYGFNLFKLNPADYVFFIALLLQLICIVRSVWVAIKLWDVYDNNDKYAQNPIELKNPNKSQHNDNPSIYSTCCLCLAVIFFIFAIIAII